MEKICELKLERVDESRWVNLKQVIYKQKGEIKKKEIIHSHDSSSILVHNTDRDVFVFVRQFRPAVFMQQTTWPGEPPKDSTLSFSTKPDNIKKGMTLEMCAGIVEGKSAVETALIEVHEEVGYDIQASQLTFITATRNNSVHSGTLGHLFYARVTEAMRVKGWLEGGNKDEGEMIEVVEMDVREVLRGVFDDTFQKPVGFTFCLLWFTNRFPHYLKSSANVVSHVEDKEENDAIKTMQQCVTDKTSCDDLEGVVDLEVMSVIDVKVSEEFKLYRLHYKQNSIQKSWDFIKAKKRCAFNQSNCCILVMNTTKGVFMLLRKFKPAIYASVHTRGSCSVEPATSLAVVDQLIGETYDMESEAGKTGGADGMWKELGRVGVRCVRDHLGYEVSEKSFEKIIHCRTHIGITGVLLTLMYVEVTEDMKVTQGHHTDNDEVVEIPVNRSYDNDDADDEEVKKNKTRDNVDENEWLKMALSPKYPLTLSLSLLWFHHHKSH